MINFRFHLVSLVSVFLALAIGLATGASIVNQGLVRAQKSQLSRLETRLRERGNQVGVERATAKRWERYAAQGEVRLVQGRLRATTVVIVRPAGGPDAPVRALATTLEAAGASLVGELTIETAAALDTESTLRLAHDSLPTASSRPATVRFMLRSRIRDALLDPDRVEPLAALARSGFVTFRGRPGGVVSSAPRLPTGARLVVVTSEDAEVDPDLVSGLLKAFVATGPARIVLAETSGEPEALRLVRRSPIFDRRISTVDNVDELEGRVALVLALEDLTLQIVGDYGVDASAKRLMPGAA